LRAEPPKAANPKGPGEAREGEGSHPWFNGGLLDPLPPTRVPSTGAFLPAKGAHNHELLAVMRLPEDFDAAPPANLLKAHPSARVCEPGPGSPW
jgi:hypothetical protein